MFLARTIDDDELCETTERGISRWLVICAKYFIFTARSAEAVLCGRTQ
jgi:hypothetical protein